MHCCCMCCSFSNPACIYDAHLGTAVTPHRDAVVTRSCRYGMGAKYHQNYQRHPLRGSRVNKRGPGTKYRYSKLFAANLTSAGIVAVVRSDLC